jgi:hypothetical protein
MIKKAIPLYDAIKSSYRSDKEQKQQMKNADIFEIKSYLIIMSKFIITHLIGKCL